MIKRSDFNLLFENYKTQQNIRFFDSVNNIKADGYDIFLSHSSKDKQYALFIRRVLIDLGFTVYMDMFDPALGPRTPDTITGERLVDILSICKCIFYIHSQNSDLSAWCPWELGYGDGLKNKVVVLEIFDDDDYKQEFLAIYPFLDYSKSEKGTNQFWVHDRLNTKKYVNLKYYIRNNEEPYIHD